MNLTFLWIFWGLANALFWYGSYSDYKSSMLQNGYGLSEKDILGINRDKYGYFDAKKFWIAHGIYWLFFTILTLVLYAYTDAHEKWMILFFFSMLFLIPAGGAMVYVAYNNKKKATRSREGVQIPILERLAQITPYDYDSVEAVFSGQGFWKRRVNGRIRAIMFPFLYKDGGDDEEFEAAFYQRIWEISQKGRGSWFSQTELRSL